jgi:TonB family protein
MGERLGTTNAPMAQVPPGVIEQLASKHRKTLLACEGTETLSGDVTVKFQINAEGQIVKSQVASTLGKPAVANCILTTVRGWKFPKPASGSATGVYAISFQ